MASLLKDDELVGPAATTNTNTSTSTGTPDTGGATAPNAPVNAQTANQNDIAAITGLNQGVDFNPLLDFVRGQGTSARNAVGSANTDFTNSLGSFSGFGDSDRNTLNSAINGSQPLSTGAALLNKSYSGPQGVNSQMYNPLIDKYVTSAGQTQNSSGIDALLQSMRPDLTPGERSYDSLVFGQDPKYQTASRDIVNDSSDLSSLGQNTATNALGSVKQRQNDIGAYNQAGSGYVASQRDALNAALASQMQQAQTNDRSKQDEYTQFLQNNQPQNFRSNVGGDFNQTVNPNQYATYTPGGIIDRNSVASQDQANQYNNEEMLLNLFDRLSSQPRLAAGNNLNMAALQLALANASQSRDSADAAWMDAHRPPPPVVAPAHQVAQGYSNNSSGDGGNAGSGEGGQGTESGASGGAAGAGSGGGGPGGGMAGGPNAAGAPGAEDPGEPSGSADPDTSDTSDSSDSSDSSDGSDGGGNGGGGQGGGGADSDGGSDSFFKGGLVKGQRGKRDTLDYAAPKQNNMPMQQQMPQMNAQQQLAMQMAQQQMPSTTNFTKGGYIPQNAGNPNVRDDIRANVDEGEFVTNAKSVKAVGPDNMNDLNSINKMPLHHQQMVRHALHTALHHAINKTAA